MENPNEDSVRKPVTLCSSCGEISLPALIKAIPIPTYPEEGDCITRSIVGFSVPQPLLFPHVQESNSHCALCSLISSQSKLESTSRPLNLAAPCPPSWAMRHGEKRVDILEPITKQSGSWTRATGYQIPSPWHINLAADEGTQFAVSHHLSCEIWLTVARVRRKQSHHMPTNDQSRVQGVFSKLSPNNKHMQL